MRSSTHIMLQLSALIFSIAVLFPTPLRGQTQPMWQYGAAAEAILQTGNVKAALATLRGELVRNDRDSVLELSLDGHFTYGEQDEVKKQHDARGSITADYNPFGRISPFIFASAEFNFQRSIDLRWDLGIGLKYVFWNVADHKASISVAELLDVTEYDPTASLENRRTSRLSFRLKGVHEFFNTIVRLSHVTFFQPSTERLRDNRWNTFIAIDFPVSDHLSLRSTYEHSFENIVPRGRKKNDAKFLFGVKLSFP